MTGAAMALESEIWMFRTRSGDYRIHNDSDDASDILLQKQIESIKSAVLEGADIKTTSFFGRFESPNLHNQHPPNYKSSVQTSSSSSKRKASKQIDKKAKEREMSKRSITVEIENQNSTSDDTPVIFNQSSSIAADGSVAINDLLLWLGSRHSHKNMDNEDNHPSDSHYQPVLPNDYIRFRIERALKFYKKRIPVCNRTRHICQILTTIASLASVLLAFLALLQWTVITAIATTGVVAWLEFQGTNNKINRYSAVVDALQNHIIWWKTRQPIEKSSTENIDHLVITCEAILRDELNAWRSSSSSQTKQSEQTNAEASTAVAEV
jgi:hypothetical protein